ncbi:M23/M56 family metallopeptidase [Brevibacillus humidisoli]|uniref:M23/M56 family metallopeptidase n=1 Tax=Brevibacillus humidisoli TaxID=2895522 RepID=UPI001E396DC4|nr:M23/M56 family metallopeptidase [Brevibacillus humidisoli]UFJ39718.1 M23/M56 family metallopeptidase [Brevibacillus humidisoli]
MSLFMIPESVFHLVVMMSPAATIVIVLVLLARRILGNRQDPRLFYFLWIALTIRLLIPWFPSGEFNLWSDVPYFADYGPYLAEQDPALLQSNPQQPEPALFKDESRFDWWIAAYWVWLIGALGVAVFFLISHVTLHTSLKKQSIPIDRANQDLAACLDRCKEKLGIHSSIALSMTTLVSSPATFGLYKPKILIPCDLEGKLNDQEWTCIFMHELIHIRRKDIFWNGLMIVLVVMHWFNPFVWKAYFKMREDQELSCDFALQKHFTPIQYGHTLTKMVEIRSGTGSYSAISFISRKTNMTKRRVEMLFSKKRTLFSLLIVTCIAIVSALIFTNPNMQALAERSDQEGSFMVPADGTVTSRYGEKTKHNVYAVSIANQKGTPVYATVDGIIQKAGYESGDGNHIVIVHSDSYESVYSHLEEIMVTEGEQVSKGQHIGTIGSTGRSTGPHLSFEIVKDGQLIDPEAVIDFHD